MPVKDFPSELMQKIQNPRCIGNHVVDMHHAILAVRLAIQEFLRFLDVNNRINAEPAHALFQPEIRRIIERLSHVRIFPVQVGLLLGKGMKIILLPFFAPGPCTAAKDGAPVGRR